MVQPLQELIRLMVPPVNSVNPGIVEGLERKTRIQVHKGLLKLNQVMPVLPRFHAIQKQDCLAVLFYGLSAQPEEVTVQLVLECGARKNVVAIRRLNEHPAHDAVNL